MHPLRSVVGQVAEGRIRGAALREFLIWYAREHAASELDQAVDELAGTGASFHSGLPAYGVMSGQWYDASEIQQLLDVLAEHDLDQEAAREGGRVVMKRTLAGVFRTVLRFLVTPERYAKHAQKIWSSYYDTGEFTVRLTDVGSITTIRQWTSHHPILCEMNVSAAEVIYETMGCRNVRVRRLKCVDGGGGACEYRAEWDR
jgi:hypothetical protein